MVLLINLAGFMVVVGLVWFAWQLIERINDPTRKLVKAAERLATKAAAAAARGDYAEAERLDDARAAVLSRLVGSEWSASGSDHDDFAQKILDEHDD